MTSSAQNQLDNLTRSSSAPECPDCINCTASGSSGSRCGALRMAGRGRHLVLEPLPRLPLRFRE